MNGAHNVLYMKKHTQTYASYPAMDKIFVGTLHCELENGANLYVNERQKIRHYRTRSTEERRRRRRTKNAKS